MIQNHMFQMLAYVCMEPPSSFAADDIRNEKAKVLRSVRALLREGGAEKYRTRPVRRRQESGRHHLPRLSQGAGRQSAIEHRNLRRPALCASTTGAGTACRSTCVPARPCGRAAPNVIVQFKKPPAAVFHGTPVSKLVVQPADLSHPARPGHRDAVPGQGSRPGHAAAAGQHALQLRRGLRSFARHRLRGDDLQLHDRRCDAVLAHRPGGVGLAHRPADAGYLDEPRSGRLSQLRGRDVGPDGGLRPDRTGRPALV